MRYILFASLCLIIFGCKRYKDPSPFTDSRLTKHYCNDPSAINYNWDFPGIADNSTCIYPAQIFSGNYFYRDTVFDALGLVSTVDSFPLQFQQLDSVHLNIIGFCGTKIHSAKANRFYTFVLDSIVGNGQNLCSSSDTIEGKGQKTGITDTNLIKLNYATLMNGDTIIHTGTAFKQ